MASSDGCSLRISMASGTGEHQQLSQQPATTPTVAALTSTAPMFIQLEPKNSNGKRKPSMLTNCKCLVDQSIGFGLRRLRRCFATSDPCNETTTTSNGCSRFRSLAPKPPIKQLQESVRYFRANHLVFHRELFCGLASTLLMIPETVAFSYVANLNPLMGLYATGIIGLVVGFFGAVPTTVAGAAGALAVVMPQLTSSDGTLGHLPYESRVDHLVMAIWLAGWLQLVFGLLNLSQVFVMIPRTAHIGFLNGLSIMMFVSQNTTFKVCKKPVVRADGTTSMPLTASTHHNFYQCQLAGELEFMSIRSASTWMTVLIVVVTICIMVFYSKACRRLSKVVPPTLIVAIVGVAIEFGINRPFIHAPVRTIGETSSLSSHHQDQGETPIVHPSLHFLPMFGSIENWSAVVTCAVTLACVGLLESIMTLQAICDLTKQTFNPRVLAKKECIAQGIANVLCGSSNAMAGCSMIGQSTGNIINGATTRLSSIMAGISMFLAITFASVVIELVPVACLTGILYVIIAHTFDWKSIVLLFRLPLYDAFAIVMVTMLAARINLVVAVVAGVLWQSLVNSWHNGLLLTCRKSREKITLVQDHDGSIRAQMASAASIVLSPTTHAAGRVKTGGEQEVTVYWLSGSVVFASIGNFRSFFDYEQDQSEWVLVDCSRSQLGDFSAVCALEEVAIRYRNVNKALVIRELDGDSMERLQYNTTRWQIDQNGWAVASPSPLSGTEAGEEASPSAVARHLQPHLSALWSSESPTTSSWAKQHHVSPNSTTLNVQDDGHDPEQFGSSQWLASPVCNNKTNYHRLQDE